MTGSAELVREIGKIAWLVLVAGYEYRHGVTSYGAFSYSLAQMLRDPEHQGADLSRLEQLTQRYVTNIVDNQVPIFVAPGPRYDLPLFETETK